MISSQVCLISVCVILNLVVLLYQDTFYILCVKGYQSKEKTNLMIFRIEALEKKELILPHCPTTAFVIFLL